MALIQALSLPAECHHTPGLSGNPRPRPSAPHTPTNVPSTSNSQEAMGSVSSLIAQRPGPAHLVRHYRPVDVVPEPGATRLHRTTLGATSCLASFDTSQDPLLSSLTPPGNRKPLMVIGSSKDSGTNGNYSYLNQDYVGDWNDNTVVHGSPGTGIDTGEAKDRQLGSLNGNVEEPPPKLVPVSGKLEKNMEKTVIRPTAFKPVVPKSHNSMQFLSPRHDRASLSDCQNNLNLLSPGGQMDTLPPCSENRNSYSGGRHTGGGSQTCSMSDSGRNSLTSLPPYGSIPCSLAPADYPPGSAHLEPTKTAHGHSNSDSGCSSSSKSTGSVSGRGQPLSDSGSSERSPAPVEGGYEGVVRDLEDKLRERNVELQQLRDNLDENEVAICQVYEEKQKRCELELEELRQSCATRMQTQSQKAQRAQQVLQLQVFQLQQEKKLLQEDFGQLLQEREKLEERCTSYEKIQLGSRLDETKWEVCQKSGEISLLKQQMKDVQGELAQRMGEIVSLRGQLRDSLGELTTSQGLLQEANTAGHTRTMELEVCQNELQRRKSEAQLLRQKVGRLEEETARLRASATNQTSLQSPAHNGGGGRQCQAFPEGEEPHLLTYESDEARAYESEALQSLRLQMDGLRAELVTERQRGEEQACSFEEEHRVWQEEKDKVIQYQKQLQQNYVGMYRRNRALERMLRKLSLELETRDELEEQDEGSGNEINFDEITATEI
ncbi:leucine zipper putative tumor suppressor 2 homolog [Oncorhynchus nerka]|uniref:leucine zipper putative tumor suppressor 2 homolog n=1 Tax=Oncorhynchus nerka TaxID=8023 RepID=UPI0011305EAD|nr:leucine zipper putative tumor suppressor 2 homolog [Oncorhynchus nerka]XP_029540261.1 leucine zipper putative tumor suppressor 2 homolog [Oncorhynchus nerka]XP_029540262.1 leucine zipper putative tumor suppressor 2 homolog [Oncorhynchus nerka]